MTCEHGGNRVPARYRALFSESILRTHRAYDPGALALARDFAAAFDRKPIYSTTSRLLVELNRSIGHRRLFSPSTPASARRQLLKRYYFPYRGRVQSNIAAAVRRGKRVVHLSCHSFAPRLNGKRRRADVGLLFDPRRRAEAELCRAWQSELRNTDRRLSVRRNYPYRGYDDGLTTYLRTRFGAPRYVGIELEVNQKFPRGNTPRWRTLRRDLVETFKAALADRANREKIVVRP